MAKAGTDQKNHAVVLPFSKIVEICQRNVQHRFGRTMITAAGIGLGVAFLTYVLEWQAIQASQEQNHGAEGLAAQQIWLVTISLITCVVGVTNTMLMNVTERFKEIGTMKCLGALDGFIVKMFLLEAGVQGVIGALGAWVFATVFVVVMSLSTYGLGVFANLPWMVLFKYLGAALLMGPLLAVFGAVYPAYTAGKMPPAVAMRSEI